MAKSLNEAARGSGDSSDFFKSKFFKILIFFILIVILLLIVNLSRDGSQPYSQVTSSPSVDNAGKGGEGQPENLEKPQIVEGKLAEVVTLEGLKVFVPSEAVSIGDLAANAFMTGKWEGIPIKGNPPERSDLYSNYNIKSREISYVEEGNVIFLYTVKVAKEDVKVFQIPVVKTGNEWFFVGYN